METDLYGRITQMHYGSLAFTCIAYLQKAKLQSKTYVGSY